MTAIPSPQPSPGGRGSREAAGEGFGTKPELQVVIEGLFAKRRFLNRHRGMADSFHAFIQNLTVATTGTTHSAAVISLPRSRVEMTDWDMQWQDKITKVYS